MTPEQFEAFARIAVPVWLVLVVALGVAILIDRNQRGPRP